MLRGLRGLLQRLLLRLLKVLRGVVLRTGTWCALRRVKGRNSTAATNNQAALFLGIVRETQLLAENHGVAALVRRKGGRKRKLVSRAVVLEQKEFGVELKVLGVIEINLGTDRRACRGVDGRASHYRARSNAGQTGRRV